MNERERITKLTEILTRIVNEENLSPSAEPTIRKLLAALFYNDKKELVAAFISQMRAKYKWFDELDTEFYNSLLYALDEKLDFFIYDFENPEYQKIITLDNVMKMDYNKWFNKTRGFFKNEPERY